MPKRNSSLLFKTMTAVLPIAGAAGLFFLSTAPITPAAVVSKGSNPTGMAKPKESLELPPMITDSLFRKRLQGPPPPPPVVEVTKEEVAAKKPKVSWPSDLKVNAIFVGVKSSLAVLTCNNQKFRCKVGDKASTIRVDAIDERAVTVSLDGESRVLKLPDSKM